MTRRTLIMVAGVGSLMLLAGAWTFQVLGYAPCKMCLWQRWPHWAAVALALLGAMAPYRTVAFAGALAAAASGAVGIFHTGVERGWWPGPSSCSGGANLGGMSGADLLSTDTLDRVVMCDQVSWALAGLSMASWNAILSFLIAAIWIRAALLPAGRP